jgi:hypothetical protein
MTEAQYTLETAPIPALLEELKKRGPAGICVLAYEDEEGEKFLGKSWGSVYWRSGIAESLYRQFSGMGAAMMICGSDFSGKPLEGSEPPGSDEDEDVTETEDET